MKLLCRPLFLETAFAQERQKQGKGDWQDDEHKDPTDDGEDYSAWRSASGGGWSSSSYKR